MTTIPDAAVEAALDALAHGCGDMWPDMHAALTAALPHLLPSNAEINESMLGELKALRASAQPLLIAANKGAARIKGLESEVENHKEQAAAWSIAHKNAMTRIGVLEEALQMITKLLSGQKSAVAASLVAIAHAALEQKVMKPEDYDCPTCNGTGARP